MTSTKSPVKLRTWLAHLALAATTFATAQQSSEQAPAKEKEEVLELSPFTVSTSANTGYGALMGTSGRLAAKYIDTPQSISIVTSELLEDFDLHDSMAATKFVPNVQQADDQRAPRWLMRGMQTTILYMDGFQLAPSNILIDTGLTDRIEVVKGPSSASYGRGNPAGFINYVLKSPLFRRSTETSVTAGTGGPQTNLRFTLDNNGFVTEDGKTAYRLVTVYSQGSTTQNHSEFERTSLLLAVDRKLGQRGDLKVSTSLLRNRNPGFVADAGWFDPHVRAARETLYNINLSSFPLFDPDKSQFVVDNTGYINEAVIGTAVLNYKLTEHWSTRQALNYTELATPHNRWSVSEITGARLINGDPQLSTTVIDWNYPVKNVSYQSDFVWQQESAFLDSRYTLLSGADITDLYVWRPAIGAVAQPYPLANWNPSKISYTITGDLNRVGVKTVGTTWSAYTQMSASFLGGKIQPSVALRKVYYDQTATTVANGAVTLLKNSTPIFGTYSLLFKPLPWLSIYGLKAKYQEPPTVLEKYAGVQITDPRSLETVVKQPTTDLGEVGIKGSLLNDKLTFSLSAFKISLTGDLRFVYLPQEVRPDGTIAFPQYRFPSDDTISGWEFEVFGQPTKRLTLMAGGGFQHGNNNLPDPVLPNTIYNVPNHPGNSVFGTAKYVFGPSADEGLTATVGVKAYLSGWSIIQGVTKSFHGEITYPDTQVSVDLGISYGFGHGRYRMGIHVSNALEEKASIVTFRHSATESGRLVLVNFDAKF